jgi:hypothetical protein
VAGCRVIACRWPGVLPGAVAVRGAVALGGAVEHGPSGGRHIVRTDAARQSDVGLPNTY